MDIHYDTIPIQEAWRCRDLCNSLMAYQRSKTRITPERFDDMRFETRLLPSLKGAPHNFLMTARDDNRDIAYVYCSIAPKETYDNSFARFFDLDSVQGALVGCLSQFYIDAPYRGLGIGSELYRRGMAWFAGFPEVEDLFVFVSNGNTEAQRFYEQRGFQVSHTILEGFITVLRQKQPAAHP